MLHKKTKKRLDIPQGGEVKRIHRKRLRWRCSLPEKRAAREFGFPGGGSEIQLMG